MNQSNKALRDEVLVLVPQTHCPASCDGRGTYATADEDGDPEPNQCQYCYEVRFPLADKLTALVTNHIKEKLRDIYAEDASDYHEQVIKVLEEVSNEK